MNWYTIYIQIGFAHFQCAQCSHLTKKKQQPIPAYLYSSWLDFMCVVCVHVRFVKNSCNSTELNIFGQHTSIGWPKCALFCEEEEKDSCWIYCIEHYYCVMWFVRIVAKSKTKRTALDIQLYKHIQQSYKFHIRATYCASSVIYRSDSIPVPDRICRPMRWQPFITFGIYKATQSHQFNRNSKLAQQI